MTPTFTILTLDAQYMTQSLSTDSSVMHQMLTMPDTTEAYPYI